MRTFDTQNVSEVLKMFNNASGGMRTLPQYFLIRTTKRLARYLRADYCYQLEGLRSSATAFEREMENRYPRTVVQHYS